MRYAISLIRLPALASALLLAPACAPRHVAVALPTPPADLFARPAEPDTPIEALTSEAVAENAKQDKIDWGRDIDARFHAACVWVRDVAKLSVDCGPAGDGE